MVRDANKRYPEEDEGVKRLWEKDGLTFTILYYAHDWGEGGGHYCGYVRFPKRPVRDLGYSGILAYVPVHGGITYSEPNDDGSMVYGFDCNHWHDEDNPQVRDEEWLVAECERMARGILIAKKYEKRYLTNVSQKGKAKVLTEMAEECEAAELDTNLDNYGFSAHINMLSGEL